MDKTGIGAKIKKLREEKGLSMDLLAYDISIKCNTKIDKSMISRWESGENEPSLERAKALSEYFDVSVDYLLSLTDDRTPARLLAYARRLSKPSPADEARQIIENELGRAARKSKKPSEKLLARRQGAET